ncbi:lamin tail domain-containing protein [Modestobacter sp. Leaf380]|uniref:lamin tail domain-containing protein n=1 Tax=Modestobacter sp. Leaf380 TaxID=1736356 RepID=UPI0006F4BFEC|nr:lamin tail domain-containing protein [Modestobacter sp. Leaf380]KQS66917.1 hypothetical protein ASG41_11055 [Modestobacter sp. Leaf380]
MRPLPRTGVLGTALVCLAGSLVLGAAVPASAAGPSPDPQAAAAAAPTGIAVNEVDPSADWVELVNTTATPQDASGLVLRDDADDHGVVVPAGTVLTPGGHVVLDTDADALGEAGFGLGKADAARLFAADGTTLLDSFSWPTQPATSWGRCPEGTGGFVVTGAATRGEVNDCTPPATTPPTTPPTVPAVPGALVVNEVESNGDDTDWVELTTTGDSPVDVSGFTFRDDDDSRVPYTLPAGSVVTPGGFLVVDQASGSNPAGFDFGLGNADSARLFDRTGAPAASYSWPAHATVSWGRCPDGTGDLVDTTRSTKGEANDCSSPVRVNEVESQDGEPGDWVELTSIGATAVDVSGYALTDAGGGRSVLPAGSTLAPGGFLVLDQLGYGLGGADSVTLTDAAGTEVDSYAWTAHATTTWGRCPDGTGDLGTTLAPTKGTANACEGAPLPWPGGPEETPVDAEDTFAGDLSGLDVEPSGTAAPGTLWAVQNGDGLLYRAVSDGAGGWTVGEPWTLAYPGGGAGVVDAEGVTVADDSAAGGVYVSSERDNSVGSVSRPSVLRYEPTGVGGTLTATREWALAPDFPGLGANAGLEGITWVPDSFLTAGGLLDASTGAAYDPARYPGHGDGLFLVGVEGTAAVYAYALSEDGSADRVATVPTGFDLVADVQFDADLGALWVVCDEACGGRTALFELTDGAFTEAAQFLPPADADPGLANEGFAVDTEATCVDGVRTTFYADDADTDGFSLRTGTLSCVDEGGENPGGEHPGGEGPPGEQPGAGGPGTPPGPGPTQPGPTHPGPTHPGPTQPGTPQPGTSQPGTVQPAPVQPVTPPVTRPATQPVAGPRPGTPAALASTGAEIGTWAALAGLLVLTGAGAVVAGRRRA